MPSNILLIVPETDTVTDGNYRRFANLLIASGNTRVTLSHMDTLGLASSDVIAMGTRIDEPLVTDTPLPSSPRPVPLQSFDVVWVLSLGNRHSFLDKIQLLHAVGERTHIINSLTSLMHLKSKYLLNSNPSVFSHPETWASTDPDHLLHR